MPTESHPELGKVVYILVTDGTLSFPLQPTEWRRKRKSSFKLEKQLRERGVIIIGYELFRILSESPKIVYENDEYDYDTKRKSHKFLTDSGPDLVGSRISGHCIRSNPKLLSDARNGIRTSRRIVLTGTPVMNDLSYSELFFMMKFVKPVLPGIKHQFD